MSNELQIYNKVSNPIEYCKEMGRAMAVSGMFGLPNEEAGMVVAMTCMCEGITPIQYRRMYHTIQGQPSMRSDAMLAEFRSRGGKHKKIERSPEAAEVELTDPDGNTDRFRLTWEEAKDEDFTQGKDGIKENYRYPRKRMQMLWARVVSDGVRTMCPEIVAGVYTPEETEDMLEAVPALRVAPTTAEPVEGSHPVQHEVKDPNAASDLQVGRIEQLIGELQMPHDAVQRALAKRGASSIDQLTRDQADELIEKLEAVQRGPTGN